MVNRLSRALLLCVNRTAPQRQNATLRCMPQATVLCLTESHVCDTETKMGAVHALRWDFKIRLGQ